MNLSTITEKKLRQLPTTKLIAMRDKMAQLYAPGGRIEKQLEEVKAEYARENPYWFYVPSDGSVSEEGMQLLSDFLKPEDIPQSFIGQKHVHLSTASVRCVSGGNRSSKTVTNCVEDYINMTGELPNSMKGWYPKEKLPTRWPRSGRVIGVDFTQLHNTVLPKYRQWCPKEFLKKGSWEESFSSQHNRLDLFKSGKKIAQIEFLTNQMEVEKMQGPELDRLTIDEECSLEIFNENLKRFATSDKLDIQMGWTPTKGITWSYDLFTKGQISGVARNFDVDSFALCAVTNPYVKISVLREILAGLSDYREIKVALLGSFESLSGFVYGSLYCDAVHKIEPFDIPSDWLVVRGLDPHMAKPTACLWAAIDHDDNVYVIDSYYQNHDIDTVKQHIAERSASYRKGWSVCDKSADSDHQLFRDTRGLCRNIYKELTRGNNPISPLWKSEKFTGSIVAGVNEIKKYLKVNEVTGKPKMFFFDTPANRMIIQSMKTMERDTYANEEDRGMKDKIKEGPHDMHACLRYIFQYPIRWMPLVVDVPELDMESSNVAVY